VLILLLFQLQEAAKNYFPRIPQIHQWLLFLLTILLNGYCMSSFAQNQNILIFGDSLSAGYGLERGEEWPNLMKKRFLDQKLSYSIINHSLSGETTSGGLTLTR